MYDIVKSIIMAAGSDVAVYLLDLPMANNQFTRIFFRTQPPDPEDVVDSKLLKMFKIPGLEYQKILSDWSDHTEFNLVEILDIIDLEDWNEWKPGDELDDAEEKQARLGGLLIGVFQACMRHSRLFFVEMGDESWTINDKLDLFYYNVRMEVVSKGIEGGGFSLNTGNPLLDALNPGSLDQLTTDIVREIVQFITVTCMFNLSNMPAGQTAPNTPLIRLMEGWIRQTEVIAGAHPERPELPEDPVVPQDDE
ncbi:hypothetical protein F5B19DRAFT_504928 [Rostrohypoxylon terebratum]|nr:hypothetical protein F5B19DRAFT_504928 [Rostrohypoxylon terebratum]